MQRLNISFPEETRAQLQALAPLYGGNISEAVRVAVADLHQRKIEGDDIVARHAELVEDWNSIWDAARSHGIEIYQPMGSEAWHWRRGDDTGAALTPGEALVEALTI